jgi:hypothetical protein
MVPEPLSEDMREFLDILNGRKAQYLVIGAHAVGVYAEPRGTKDLDIWINPTRANAARVYAALKDFGAPLFGMTQKALVGKDDFLIIGVAPNRIDLLKSIPGLKFQPCWKNRRTFDISGTKAHFLNLDDLITAKLAAGRPQDLVDAAKLRKALALEQKEHQASRLRPGSTKPEPRRQRERRKTPGPNPEGGEQGHGPAR